MREALSELRTCVLFTGDQLAKIGMKAKQDILEAKVAYERLNNRDFDLVP